MSKKIVFPRDENAHNFIVEWWYLNGILSDRQGNRYAIMDCLFKVDQKIFYSHLPRRYAYFSHAIVSEIKNKKFYHEITPVLVSKDSFKKKLLYIDYKRFSIDKITNSRLEEINPFTYKIVSDTLELNLVSTKKPLLEQKNGYVHLNTKSTYYYSLTNLNADGYIKIKKRQILVKGKAWMDHQWANSSASLDKWIWFSLQLKNNAEIVCFEFDDKKKKTTLAGYIDNKSKTAHTNNIKFTQLKKSYKSKKTGTIYPLSYKIEIPKLRATLKTTPLMHNQEVLFANINYWEGPVKVTGKIKSKKVSGYGFMELVGFPKNKSLIEIYTNLLKKELEKQTTKIKNITYKTTKSTIKNLLLKIKS